MKAAEGKGGVSKAPMRTKSAAALAGVSTEHKLVRTADELQQHLAPWVSGRHCVVRAVPQRLQDSGWREEEQADGTRGLTRRAVNCGLVALLMAADALVPSHGCTAESLLAAARAQRFSEEGEMFDAQQMGVLAELCVAGLDARVTCEPWSGASVATHVAAGGLVLIPYDCDKNFGPARLEGEKAHWCVVVGYAHPSAQGGGIFFAPCALEASAAGVDELLCVQPKSRRVHVWKTSELQESNGQLMHSTSDVGIFTLSTSLRVRRVGGRLCPSISLASHQNCAVWLTRRTL